MANTRTSAGVSALIASDLVVEILPRFICRFHGTRAQLEAEGLIPAGFVWPQRRARAYWVAGQFRYWLERQRPQDFKGSVRAFGEGDYWVCDVDVDGHFVQSHLVYAKTKEIEALVRYNTPEGRSEYRRAYQAKQDGPYLAFRAQLLGDMVPCKKGRSAKSCTAPNPQGVTA